MKFVMDERVKHRLTGLIVILSIAAIFLPAVMKKSNQRFEDSVSVSVRLPAKPQTPKVAMTQEKVLFQRVKVARVELPTLPAEPRPVQLVKAEPLSIKSSLPPAPALANHPVAIAKPAPLSNVPSEVVASTIPSMPTPPVAKLAVAASKSKPKPVLAKLETSVPSGAKAAAKKIVRKREAYAVQLASFSQQSNVQSLVSRLRSKGFIASYTKVSSGHGDYYKVVVGQVNAKAEAVHLQKQILASMQMHGFVVKTGVS